MDHAVSDSVMHEDITAHVAYDKGLNEGLERGERECDRVIVIREDLAFEKGYESGKKFAQDKVLELMNEVITEYEKLAENDVDPEIRAQISAVRFMKSWVTSGGQEDFDGNRVCLPW